MDQEDSGTSVRELNLLDSTTGIEDYKYESLPTLTCVRLLRINGKLPNGLLDCSLKIADLEEAPCYHTYSYTWGNPFTDNFRFRSTFDAQSELYTSDIKVPISCDGKLLYVNKNLHTALSSVPQDAWLKRCNRRDRRNHSRTLLHLASITDDVDWIKILIRANADIDVVDDFGTTPLGYAVKNGSIEAVKALLYAGADAKTADGDQRTVLDYAQGASYVDIVKLLEGFTMQGPNPEVGRPGPQEWVWIDQVCIDQCNLEERASQVSIMDRIYESSQFTLAWLGEKDEYTEMAVQTILKYDLADGNIAESEIIPYSSDEAELYAKGNIPFISSNEWEALAALFSRPYFRRLWVVQEIILSRWIVGYCGAREIPWEALYRLAHNVFARQLDLGHPTSATFIDPTKAVVAIENELVTMMGWREQFIKGDRALKPKRFSLRALIMDTWTFKASDQRDKVFGLYGLLNKTAKAQFKPDYSKTIEEVYTEATTRIMKESDNLDILSAVVDHSLKQNRNIPSWVPDYGTPFTNMMSAFFNAAGNLPRPPIRSSHWSRIGVTGAKIDSILQVGNTTDGPGALSLYFDSRWFELALLLPNPYYTGQLRTEVLWRTLCADQKPNTSSPIPETLSSTSPAPSMYGDYFRNILCIMVCIRADEEIREATTNPAAAPTIEADSERVKLFMSNPPMSEHTPEDIQQMFSHPESNLSSPHEQSLTYLLFKLHLLAVAESNPATPTIYQVEKLYNSIDWAKYRAGSNIQLPDEGFELYSGLKQKYGRRRLFVTEKRYLGLGPASMVEGDEVWVLPGAGAAFVLRGVGRVEEERRFALVGEAYVHGIMNGEAVEGSDIEVHDIELV
jgi:hypothetical protein